MNKFFFCFIFCLVTNISFSQDCNNLIKMEEGRLNSLPTSIIVRPNYSYSFKFSANDNNLLLIVKSVGGEPLDIYNEILFLSVYNRKLTLKFNQDPKVTHNDVDVYTNVFVLSKENLEWFSNNELAFIYIKNTTKDKLVKYIAKKDKRNYFKELSKCFKNEWKITYENAKDESSDDELINLQLDLSNLKKNLKKEIEHERLVANKKKLEIQNNVINQKSIADNKIEQFSEEVRIARAKSLAVIERKNQWAIDSIININKQFKSKLDQHKNKVALEEHKSMVIISQIVKERDENVKVILQDYNRRLNLNDKQKQALILSNKNEILKINNSKLNAIKKLDSQYELHLLGIISNVKNREDRLNATLTDKVLTTQEKLKEVDLMMLDSITDLKRGFILSVDSIKRNQLIAFESLARIKQNIKTKNAFDVKTIKEKFVNEKQQLYLNHEFELNDIKNNYSSLKSSYYQKNEHIKFLNDSLALVQDSLKNVIVNNINQLKKKSKNVIYSIDKQASDKKMQLEIKSNLDSIRIVNLRDNYLNRLEQMSTDKSVVDNVKKEFLDEVIALQKDYNSKKNVLEKRLIDEQQSLAIRLLETQEKAYDEFNIIQEQLALAIVEERAFYASKLKEVKDDFLTKKDNLTVLKHEELKQREIAFNRQLEIYNNNIMTLQGLIDNAKKKALLEVKEIEENHEKDLKLIRQRMQYEILELKE